MKRGNFYRYIENVVTLELDSERCIGCGNCSTYCEMGIDVRSYAMRGESFKRASCVGCGLCATVCPSEALHLERRLPGKIPPPPADFRDWMAQRAEARGLTGVS